jgi:predicted glycoside hydrolase/deacetylase ChbG (UPF0249 family)
MALRLILNADDFGYDPAVTRGIVQSMREGIVSSTTMIVNSPHSAEAARDAKGLAIGLHLNLVRFEAVSTKQPLDEKTNHERAFVEQETHAQLDRLRALLGRDATHLDVHKHWHLKSEVLAGLAAAAKQRGLAVRSINDAQRTELQRLGVHTNDAFLGDAGTDAYWTVERWEDQLRLAPRDGVVELMCHPGYRPSHLSSGYGEQRETELTTFLDPRARAALTTLGLTLSSWAGV